MKAHILYTPNTPADREIEYLQRRLGEAGINSDLIDADSREGTAFAELYDLMGRPAVVVASDDGTLLQSWQTTLPSLEEVVSASGAY